MLKERKKYVNVRIDVTHILSVLSAKKGLRNNKMRSRGKKNSKSQRQTYIGSWIARLSIISFGSRGPLASLEDTQQKVRQHEGTLA